MGDGLIPTKPVVSVIICHHVGRDLIARCLDSVQKTVGVTVETLVVTSDPTYTAPAWVRQFYLEEGPAWKRNLGAARSHGAYLAFLDDDVEISPYCLYEFVHFMETHPSCGMTFGKIYKMEAGRRDEFDAAGSWITWTGFLFDRAGNAQRDTRQYDTPCRILSAKSATCLVRGRAFRESSGFDRAYFILGEETDLSWRLWLRGWEVWYVPTAVSWHAFGCPTLKEKTLYYEDSRIFFRGPSNYLSMLLTNSGAVRLPLMLCCQVLAWTVAAASFACRGEWQMARLILSGLWDALVHRLPSTWRKRQHVQSTRVVRDHELWPQISHTPPPRYYLNRLLRYTRQGYHG